MSQWNYGFPPSLAGLESTDLDPCDVDEDFNSIKKRLFYRESTDSAPYPKTKKEAVQVFLRVKPRSTLEIQLKEAECFHFDDQELIAIAPKTSKMKVAASKNEKFTFTKIFGPNTSQSDLFEETLLPSLKDFLDGQNCLVFTYGITNSGKTHTVSGSPSDPGLLPRTLDVVFNSVQDGKLLQEVKFKPKHYSEVSYLNQEELTSERAIKENILAKAIDKTMTSSTWLFPVLDETVSDGDVSSVSTLSKVSSISKLSTDDTGMSFSSQDSSAVDLDDSGHYYSVWISYAEIYNEFIYDLLGEPPTKNKLRPVLKLQEDRNHNLFIKGLREVQVDSVEEALLLMRYGLCNRSQAATRLNYHSSRSHSVYTIKLVKVASTDKPANALVNRVSIVDLAGAERSSKTGASGMRVKEAGQINKSLLTLGKCIDAMKHNQFKKSDDLLVPFRESKLTRLFQNYFVGKGGKEARQGKVTMFVNISNTGSVFDETMHVLKFSALTSKVIPLIKCLPGPTPHKSSKTSARPPPTPSTLTHTHTVVRTEESLSESDSSSNTDGTHSKECTHCKSLEAAVTALRCELREKEYRVRQDVCQEFNEQLIEIEDYHSREMEEQAVEIEEMYEKRMNNLQKSMKKQYSRKRRRRDDDGGECDSEKRLRELEERNIELEEELELERERAAAKMGDTVESHETQVVTLNKQLAGKCVEFLEQSKELTRLKEQLSSLQTEVTRLRRQEEELVIQLGSLSEKLMSADRSAEYALAEVDILTSRISELTTENQSIEAAKIEFTEQLKVANISAGPSEDERVTSLQRELTALVSRHQEEREAWLLENATLTQAQVECVEVELIKSANDEEKASLVAQLESVKSASNEEKASLVAQLESVKSASDEEKASLVAQLELIKSASDEEKASLVAQLELIKSAHNEEKASAQNSNKAAWEEMLESLKEAHLIETTDIQVRLRGRHNAEILTLEDTVARLKQVVADKTAEILELSNQKDSLNTDVKRTLRDYETTLKNQTAHIEDLKRENEVAVLQNEELTQQCSDLELRVSRVCAAREAHSSRVEELTNSLDDSRKALTQRESELLDSSDQCRAVLEETISDLKKSSATQEHQLTIVREDYKTLQTTLTDKESELLSLAKCVGGGKAEVELLHAQLQELTSQHQAHHENHQTLINEIKGTHQLELAQYSIRVRELNEELETKKMELESNREELECKSAEFANAGSSYESEMESVRADWDNEVTGLNKKLQQAEKKLNKLVVIEAELKCVKKSSQQLKKDLDKKTKAVTSLEDTVNSLEDTLRTRDQELLKVKIAHESAIQAVKDEWRSEVGNMRAEAAADPIYEDLHVPEASSEQPTFYDYVCDDCVVSEKTHPVVNYKTPVSNIPKPVESTASSRRSYLVAMTNNSIPVCESNELDSSKPIVPILDSSSQLMDDTLVSESRLVIDVTPLKSKKRKKPKEKENIVSSPPPEKKTKYTLRTRTKKVKYCSTQDTNSLEQFTPGSQKSFIQHFIRTKKTRVPVTPKQDTHHCPEEPVTGISTRTRNRIFKSQISGPLELECFNSPANPARQSARGVYLGTKLRRGDC